MKTIVNWHLPLKTASESNKCSIIFKKKYRLKDGSELIIKKRKAEHWNQANARHQEQKRRIFQEFVVNPPSFSFPCHVILTRIAPRKLDEGDNLPCSMKYIRDAISENLTGITQAGRADGDNRITWEYKQIKGEPKEYAVQIEFISEKKYVDDQ